MWQIVRFRKIDLRYMWQIVRFRKIDLRYMWQFSAGKSC